MQRLSILFIVFILIAISSAGSSTAAPPARAQPADHALLAQLQQQTDGQIRIERHAETGKVRFLAAAPGEVIQRPLGIAANASAEQAARGFLANYGTLFGLRRQSDQLTLLREPSFGGRAFTRFQQRYRSVPVLGGELVVQTDARRNIVTASGEVLPDIAVDTTPRIRQQQAQEQARVAVAQMYRLPVSTLAVGEPQLWIFNPNLLGGPGLRLTRLVWRVEVRASTTSTPVRELVLVDAQRGNIALHFNQIAEGKERHVCDNNNVPDADNNETNDCLLGYVRSENGPESAINDVNRAYDYSGATYDFYKAHFGRDSIDDHGMPLISLTRYCFANTACPYKNAFWDGQQMTYGAGFASADDVVGHELTHGVTEHTSGLFYYYQSGAINEAMSDIFGELIDLTDGAGNDSADVRWQIGEDLPAEIGAIRDMRDPHAYGQPDRMIDAQYNNDPFFQDNGGVHRNSGVANKAAYLIADGDTFNGYAVRGLGLEKMGQIFYRVNTALLTSGSDYQDLGDALPAACRSLIGTAGIVEADCGEVAKAVAATEMEQQPAKAAAPEAAVCAPDLFAHNTFYDDLENVASGNWISAPITGTINAWYYPQQSAPNNLFSNSSYATSGVNNFWGYDQGSNQFLVDLPPADYAIAMTRDVVVPPNASFHFRHAYDFETMYDYAAQQYIHFDGAVAEYSTDHGLTWNDLGPLFDENGYTGILTDTSNNPLGGRAAFAGYSNGYTSSRADLSALAGQQARFRFRIGTDSYGDGYGWFIDDIRVYTCNAAPIPEPTSEPTPQPTSEPTPQPLPSLAWSSSAISVPAGRANVALPVMLSSASSQIVAVRYGVTSDTTTQNTDYTLLDGTLMFPPGTTIQTVTLTLNENTAATADRTIIVTLSEPTNATLGTDASVTVTIAHTDVATPTVLPQRVFLPLMSR